MKMRVYSCALEFDLQESVVPHMCSDTILYDLDSGNTWSMNMSVKSCMPNWTIMLYECGVQGALVMFFWSTEMIGGPASNSLTQPYAQSAYLALEPQNAVD
jgi:hypothetical protein